MIKTNMNNAYICMHHTVESEDSNLATAVLLCLTGCCLCENFHSGISYNWSSALITPAYAVTLVPVMYVIQEEACVDLPLDSYKVMPNIS